MTLLDEIESKCTPEMILSGDIAAITAIVNQNRKKVIKFEGGVGSIMKALGAVEGSQFLNLLENLSQTDSSIKWAMRLILAGNLDFGDELVRSQIDQLTDPVNSAKLKSLAEIPYPVSCGEIAHALGLTGWSATLNSTSVADGLVHCNVKFEKVGDSARGFTKVFSAQDMTKEHLKSLCDDMIIQLYTRDKAQAGLDNTTVL